QIQLRDGTRDGVGTNLHALWDSGLFRGLPESETRHLARLRELPAAAAADGDPADWAMESCALLQQGIYPAGARIGQDYVDRWRPVAEQRLVIAGQRLAALLNRTLAGDP